MSIHQQVNRRLRGHDFYECLEELPALYDTVGIPTGDKVIAAHFFISRTNWWIAEYDDGTGNALGYGTGNAFGFLDLGFDTGGWGYFHMPELEAFITKSGGLVERDLDWQPKTVREVIPEAIPASSYSEA